MKARVLGLGLLLALFAVFLTRGAGPGPGPRAPLEAVRTFRAPAQGPSEAPAFETDRDPFRYLEDGPDFLGTGPPASSDPRLEASAAPTLPPLRLLGFIRRGDSLLAALSLHGVVVTAGAGESAEGFEVLAVDEDSGVRLRAADGTELTLVQPPE